MSHKTIPDLKMVAMWRHGCGPHVGSDPTADNAPATTMLIDSQPSLHKALDLQTDCIDCLFKMESFSGLTTWSNVHNPVMDRSDTFGATMRLTLSGIDN